jgi:uracil-DNA glycosylase family 4
LGTFFWIGQNPGIVKIKKTDHVFPISENNNKQQDEFTQFIYDIKMYNQSYFSNVIKCATPNNRQPQKDEVTNCLLFLLNEIEFVKPSIIICLGTFSKYVIDTLRISDNKKKFHYIHRKIFYLYHPTYVFSYNRNLIHEYKQQILTIKNYEDIR